MTDRRQRETKAAWAERESKHRVPGWDAKRGRLCEQQAHRCCHCGRRFEDGHPQLQPTIDHILPRQFGGSDSFENLVAACLECNGLRGTDIGWRPTGKRWTAAELRDARRATAAPGAQHMVEGEQTE